MPKPKYKNKIELEKKIFEFFNDNEIKGLIPTIEMLGVKLGMSRQAILNYQNSEQYGNIITEAKERITALKSQALVNGFGSTTGLIFDLKNNAGYSDKTEVVAKNYNVNFDKGEVSNYSEEELMKIVNG